jgi:pyrrolidone-carboxylate peptidase
LKAVFHSLKIKKMKFLLTLFALILSANAHAEKHKIILSYFSAFAGRETNHTQVIAPLIRDKLASEDDIELVLCPAKEGSPGLDVSFYSPRTDILQRDGSVGPMKGTQFSYTELQQCYDANPDAEQVISLGEGTCDIEVGAAANNAMWSGKQAINIDMNGNMMVTGQKIETDGPSIIKTDDNTLFALCMEKVRMQSQDTKVPNLLLYSNSMGAWVCNNVAYNFMRKNVPTHPKLSFSFVHVPVAYGTHTSLNCDTGPFRKALKIQGKPLNTANYSQLIADQVAQYITDKNLIIHDLNPSMLSEPAIASCIDTAKKTREDAQKFYDHNYSKYR